MGREITKELSPFKKGFYPVYSPIVIKQFIEFAQEFVSGGSNLQFLLF